VVYVIIWGVISVGIGAQMSRCVRDGNWLFDHLRASERLLSGAGWS